MFTDDFLSKLPSDPVEAASLMCSTFLEWDEGFASNRRLDVYSDYVRAFAALEAFCAATGINKRAPAPFKTQFGHVESIRSYFQDVTADLAQQETEILLARSRRIYQARFGEVFAYELSQGDLERVQLLINELRVEISGATCFEPKHQQRLLAKLESLQRELHKKMSSLDQFWGLLGEAGVVIGKFGEDTKPIVDRIREIIQIIWSTQARTEELPSGMEVPTLPSKSDDSASD
jgi:hypothetical protein